MKNEAFSLLLSQITDDPVGAEIKMAICFTNNISSALGLVSVVRANNF